MKNILNMMFSDDNFPDVGSIEIDRQDGGLLLLNEDVNKLNTILTRAVCVGTYNVPVFEFTNGYTAFVRDTLKMFLYDSKYDRWDNVEELT